jgi:micrococcal nuclease
MHATILQTISIAALFAALVPSSAAAKDRPVAAEVVRAVDGDTLQVRATIWIGQELTTNVRIRGIDAPEVHGKCQHEKDMAAAATRRITDLATGDIQLSNVENDKYGGRVIADVTTANGAGLAAEMLASGLVRAYDGGERMPWCGVASAGD